MRLLRIALLVVESVPVIGLPMVIVPIPKLLSPTLLMVPPGAMPGPLTNIPAERPAVPASVITLVPLLAVAIWETAAGPPEKTRMPVVPEDSVPKSEPPCRLSVPEPMPVFAKLEFTEPTVTPSEEVKEVPTFKMNVVPAVICWEVVVPDKRIVPPTSVPVTMAPAGMPYPEIVIPG